MDAGIKPWIVTGDKDSTAKSIGYASGVLSEDRNVQQFDQIIEDDVEETLIKMSRLGNTDFLISGLAFATFMKATEHST